MSIKRIGRREKKKKAKKKKEINIEQTLLKDRTLFFMDRVGTKSSREIIKQLYALDKISHKEITLMISSFGGNIESGFAIMDAIRNTKSKVHTIISGAAYSMGSLISIVGDKRSMTEDCIWMAHPGLEGIVDYFEFIRDRIKSLDIIDKIIDRIYTKNTKLTKKEINFAKRGELWLASDECLKKGIVDKIIK
jgi:ATP-dependent Clp protease protease subunit